MYMYTYTYDFYDIFFCPDLLEFAMKLMCCHGPQDVCRKHSVHYHQCGRLRFSSMGIRQNNNFAGEKNASPLDFGGFRQTHQDFQWNIDELQLTSDGSVDVHPSQSDSFFAISDEPIGLMIFY